MIYILLGLISLPNITPIRLWLVLRFFSGQGKAGIFIRSGTNIGKLMLCFGDFGLWDASMCSLWWWEMALPGQMSGSPGSWGHQYQHWALKNKGPHSLVALPPQLPLIALALSTGVPSIPSFIAPCFIALHWYHIFYKLKAVATLGQTSLPAPFFQWHLLLCISVSHLGNLHIPNYFITIIFLMVTCDQCLWLAESSDDSIFSNKVFFNWGTSCF